MSDNLLDSQPFEIFAEGYQFGIYDSRQEVLSEWRGDCVESPHYRREGDLVWVFTKDDSNSHSIRIDWLREPPTDDFCSRFRNYFVVEFANSSSEFAIFGHEDLGIIRTPVADVACLIARVENDGNEDYELYFFRSQKTTFESGGTEVGNYPNPKTLPTFRFIVPRNATNVRKKQSGVRFLLGDSSFILFAADCSTLPNNAKGMSEETLKNGLKGRCWKGKTSSYYLLDTGNGCCMLTVTNSSPNIEPVALDFLRSVNVE